MSRLDLIAAAQRERRECQHLTGRRCEATTYVFGNALIAIEMTRHVARAALYVPLRLFVEAIADDRVRVTYDLPSDAGRGSRG
jgi:hypothetical protein